MDGWLFRLAALAVLPHLVRGEMREWLPRRQPEPIEIRMVPPDLPFYDEITERRA